MALCRGRFCTRDGLWVKSGINCPEGFAEHTTGQANRYKMNSNPYFRPHQLLLLLLLLLLLDTFVVVGPFVESFVTFSPLPLVIGFRWNRAV